MTGGRPSRPARLRVKAVPREDGAKYLRKRGWGQHNNWGFLEITASRGGPRGMVGPFQELLGNRTEGKGGGERQLYVKTINHLELWRYFGRYRD